MRISDWSSDVCSSDLAFASSWPLIADERVEEHIFLIIGPLDTNDYARSGKNALAILGDAILIELPRHHNGNIEFGGEIGQHLGGVILLLRSILLGSDDLDQDRKSTRLNSSH